MLSLSAQMVLASNDASDSCNLACASWCHAAGVIDSECAICLFTSNCTMLLEMLLDVRTALQFQRCRCTCSACSQKRNVNITHVPLVFCLKPLHVLDSTSPLALTMSCRHVYPATAHAYATQGHHHSMLDAMI